MRPIRGILLDKDGTLVDFEATWFAIADAMALEAAGGDRERADRLMAAAGYDHARGRFLPESVLATGTNAEIAALWYRGLDAGELAARIRYLDRVTAAEGARRAVALPGVLEAVAALHAAGMRLGLTTSDSTAGAEMTLTALGIAQMFEAVYGYDAVAVPKPAPETVLAFCDLTGLRPDEIAVVGDSRRDLEMGRAAGVGITVAVLSGTGVSGMLAPLADAVLPSAAEFPAFLANLSTRA